MDGDRKRYYVKNNKWPFSGSEPKKNGLCEIQSCNVVNSPLKLFVDAKRKITSIFDEIFDFVQNVIEFSTDMPMQFLNPKNKEEILAFRIKITAIREVLKRDSMKVAFFGRTSSGKSTVINAMLSSKILPSGIGHTTNCFLQIEGSDSNEAYLNTANSRAKQNVESVSQLGHALCKEKLSENELITIHWPKEKCLLLHHDVILVDSPGVDVTPNLDECIDKFCMDADVFVLVANAESTLMVTEKNFFHNVSLKISKPNVFIVHNRWDISETEPEFLLEVHKQHLDRAIDFLTKELKIYSQEEAYNRIFFISAKEALQIRLKQKGELVTPHSIEGYHSRYFEFLNFEQKFEECISKSAIKTKFEQHFKCAQSIVKKSIEYLDAIIALVDEQCTKNSENRTNIIEKINDVEIALKNITKEMKERIQNIVENVEQRVSKALNEEIRRLNIIIEEFTLPFDPNSYALQLYKTKLNTHIEHGLGINLKSKLSDSVNENIVNNQQDMKNRILSFVPEKYYLNNDEYNEFLQHAEYRTFEIFYRLNCNNLCSDFHENLEFRFSWNLIRVFQKNINRIIQIISLLVRLPNSIENNDIKPLKESNSLPIVIKSTLLSFGPESSLIISGFMITFIGWRIAIFGGFFYVTLYVYERVNWTVSAQEKSFKKQYIQHATNKLRLIVDLTSADCSQQVQQELSTTFARLCGLVNDATNQMHNEISYIDSNLKELKRLIEQCKNLKNKAAYLLKELKDFENNFLMHTNF